MVLDFKVEGVPTTPRIKGGGIVVPKKSEGEVRPDKGKAAPMDIDALLCQALSDPSALPPELAAAIDRVIERSHRQHPQQGIQPQIGAARRKVERTNVVP